MKTRSGLSLLFALTIAALAGLSCSDRSPVSPGSNGLLTLDLRLSKVSEQAIDRVLVVAKNPPMEPVSGELTVTGKTATGSLEVFPGKWLVVVEAFSDTTLCYHGVIGPVDVVAGKSTTTPPIALEATRDLVTEEVFIRWSETKGRVDPKDLVVGSVVDLVLSCRNAGSADAAGWRFEAYLDEVLLCSLNDVEILAGKEWLLWCRDWTATEGTHTIEFRLDTENVIGESDETNNTVSLTFTIQPPVDLVAEEVFITRAGGDVPIDPNSLMEGDEVDLNVRVRNTSSSDIAGWRAQSYIDGEAYRHGDFSVGAHSATLIFATWTAVAGTHTVTWTVDSEDVIKESDETNNSAPLTFTVGENLADLKVQRIYFSERGNADNELPPSLIRDGDEVDIRLEYENTGSADASGWRGEVHIDGVLDGWLDDASIVAMSSRSIRHEWTAEAGEHIVEFRLDTEHVIPETDEDNNDLSLVFTVQPSGGS